MIGAAEYLLADIAGLGIAPDRLLAGAREAAARAFGAEHEACEREIEGAGKSDQHHRGRTDLGALDLADRGLGDAGARGQLSQRPAAAVALEFDPMGQALAEFVY